MSLEGGLVLAQYRSEFRRGRNTCQCSLWGPGREAKGQGRVWIPISLAAGPCPTVAVLASAVAASETL